MRKTLSVAIITRNEEANLARTLGSVAWADEIVVVDSGSNDRTEEIARSFRSRFFLEEWKGFAAQKNSALEKCSCDWILSLDADESLSDELAKEIWELLERRSSVRRVRAAAPQSFSRALDALWRLLSRSQAQAFSSRRSRVRSPASA